MSLKRITSFNSLIMSTVNVTENLLIFFIATCVPLYNARFANTWPSCWDIVLADPGPSMLRGWDPVRAGDLKKQQQQKTIKRILHSQMTDFIFFASIFCFDFLFPFWVSLRWNIKITTKFTSKNCQKTTYTADWSHQYKLNKNRKCISWQKFLSADEKCINLHQYEFLLRF